jgi:hypothetical protein
MLEVGMEAMIFTTPVRLNCSDFGIKEALNMSLELIKDALNVRFMFD